LALASSHLSDGLHLALEQLRAIERAEPGGLTIVDVVTPPARGDSLQVDISLDCHGFEHRCDGITLHGRERFQLTLGADFPFAVPSARVRHRRWAGSAHVHWARLLCLYVATAVEWQPADGMYGFIERLEVWLRAAALGELDPQDAPLHPPVTYAWSGKPLVIPRADAPPIGDSVWVGAATLERPGDDRYDITGWERKDPGKPFVPAKGSAAAIMLTTPMDWEFPETVAGLILALKQRGLKVPELLDLLGYVGIFREASEPLLVIIGTPMRRGADGEPRQHLTAWQVAPGAVTALMDMLGAKLGVSGFAERGPEAIDKFFDWAAAADAKWCAVREGRSEVTERRDSSSPLRWFAGRTVSVWGCGALGGPIAEALVRAGVGKLRLYDNAHVAPGLMVRQFFDDADIGSSKAKRLKAKLDGIDRGVDIEANHENVLTGPLDRAEWDDDADVVIDATANGMIQAKLERVRARRPGRAAIITGLFGHTAERGLVTVGLRNHSGAGADVLRQVKLACARAPHLRGFLEEFWPAQSRTDRFQPEPGCSSPTFRGSYAETSTLAGMLLTAAAAELATPGARDSAVAHLVALPTVAHDGPRAARLSWPPALVAGVGDGGTQVRVSASACAEVRGWISHGSRTLPAGTETGGILFGERDEAAGVVWIDDASGPPPDSIESPELFLCGTEGVKELDQARRRTSRGSVGFLGMWHTHPVQSPDFSSRDLRGMLELLDAAPSPRAQGLIVIVGWAQAAPQLAAYVFDRHELTEGYDQLTIQCHNPQPLPAPPPAPPRDVGLALSGGGSRAIAFHLGCLRALHDRGVLDRVAVVSGVSGGSVMSALWAYSVDDFESFDARVCDLLRRGLLVPIARRALLSPRAPQGLASRLAASGASALSRAPHRLFNLGRRVTGRARHELPPPPVRRAVSRTDAFADVLADRVLGDLRMDAPRRGGRDVVINACDLATGSAFRFGSRESGTWQHGALVGNSVPLATAVAASAAYPLVLPALDREWLFERRNGEQHRERVVLTDGGVFDNLGTTCLLPRRDAAYSTNVFDVAYIVTCDAGRGLLERSTPIGWPSRVARSFEATFRKAQDGQRARLHEFAVGGELRGFVMPYLGQLDRSLPWRPAELTPREAVADYPTDFAAMGQDALDLLAGRGEQLTRLLIEAHCPQL
jgi:predicted acylesterase/phospholipase RssA